MKQKSRNKSAPHGPSVSADNDWPSDAALTDFGTENLADEFEMSV